MPCAARAASAGPCAEPISPKHSAGCSIWSEDGIDPDCHIASTRTDGLQQLRDIALGRKNYLFAGSHDAARRAANLYSLARTCAQHRVPPLPYFTDVLAKLAAGWPQDRLDELLPHRWRLPEAAAPDTSGT